MRRSLHALALRTLLCVLCLASTVVSAQTPGRNGACTVTGSVAPGSVAASFNPTTTLTAGVAAAGTTLNVTSAAALALPGTLGGCTIANTALAAGDVLMIYTPNGATINTANTVAYGSVTAINNAGNWEYVVVSAVAGNTITVNPAAGSYLCTAGTGTRYAHSTGAMVIRVPQFSRFIVNSGVTINPFAWNGSVGGVLALAVREDTILNGTLDASGRGFRGGRADTDGNTVNGDVNYVTTGNNVNACGEKGESIAYTQGGNGTVLCGRGASANGGGGGNGHNSAGGGGANGDNGNTWTGQGVMCTTPGATCAISAGAVVAAWSLDPGYIANGNAFTTSSGGGRGGYSWSNGTSNPLTLPPGSWSDDGRREVGGLGGRPLNFAANQRIFFGGGGGSGDANNNSTNPGGNGGGIVVLVTNVLSGAGSINVSGAVGGNAPAAGSNDAPSGAGGGGTALLSVVNTVGSAPAIAVNAAGGAGGIHLNTGGENEGGGGGGGGGVVATTTGLSGITSSIVGGVNGFTSSSPMVNFVANGGTLGATGAAPAAGAPPVCATTNFIAGRVFEDVNYGGGAGRTFVTALSSAVGSGFTTNAAQDIRVPNARMELFTIAGTTATQVATVNTDAAGYYVFGGLTPATTHAVRLVNATAASRRVGACAAGTCIPVQTFRSDGTTSVSTEVGGRAPAFVDCNQSAAGNTFNTGTFVGIAAFCPVSTPARRVESFSTAVPSSFPATGLADFGVNFDTIVNINNGGAGILAQGSLRQFIINSNALGGEATLVQSGSRVDSITGATSGLPPNRESTIFMVPNAALSAGVVVINPATDLPAITGANAQFTIIDGGTQTANIGNTNAGVQGAGGTVGVLATALPQIQRPEVQINGTGTAPNVGIDIGAPNVTVRAVSVFGFGNGVDNGAFAQIRQLAAANAGVVLEGNYIGSPATTFLGTGADGNGARNNADGVQNQGNNLIVRYNLIGFNGGKGVAGADGTTGLYVLGNEIRRNAVNNSCIDGVDAQGGSSRIESNLAINNFGVGLDGFNADGNHLFFNNTVTGNGYDMPAGSGTNGVRTNIALGATSCENPGIRVHGGTGARVENNIVFQNSGAGVMVTNGAQQTLISKNSIYLNGTVGATPTGQIGIDLTSGSASDQTGAGNPLLPNPPGPFVTVNDTNDADAGSNNLQNFPVLNIASLSGTNITITGWAACNARVEFFIADPDPTGFGEGRTYLFDGVVGGPQDSGAGTNGYTGPVNGAPVGTDTNAAGCPAGTAKFFSFTFTKPGSVNVSTILTSTATVGGNTTSEFSNNIRVGAVGGVIAGRVFRDSGVGAGAVANNGILEQNEEATNGPGVAGIPIALTNCAATVYATQVTDTQGSFAFPNTVVTGGPAAVCVVKTNTPSVVSTGASTGVTTGATVSFGGTALPSNVTTTVDTIAYTYCRGEVACTLAQPADSVRFAFSGSATNAYINFGVVPAPMFVANGIQQVPAGQVAFYPHVFTAGTTGVVSFGLSVNATQPNIPGWSEVLYRDTNCNGQADAADPIITPATTENVTAGQQVCVVMKQFTPPAAPFGASRVVNITAGFVYGAGISPPLSATIQRTDTTTIGDKSDLTLVKDVCNTTITTCTDTLVDATSLASNGNYAPSNTGKPGDVLRYRVIYTNGAEGSLTNVVIRDTTPPFTAFVSQACAVTPPGLPTLTCTPVSTCSGGTCTLTWTLSGRPLRSGERGIVTFDVTIQ